jgi:hypothetical protein
MNDPSHPVFVSDDLKAVNNERGPGNRDFPECATLGSYDFASEKRIFPAVNWEHRSPGDSTHPWIGRLLAAF